MNTKSKRTHARILLVDDNPTNLKVISGALAELGCQLLVARSGAEALVIVEKGKPDVILLDISMPGMDGFEVLQHLREDFSSTQLPVIMATARGEGGDIVSALKMGANDYITKPFDFDVLAARVENQLALKRAVDEILRLQTERDYLRSEIQDSQAYGAIIGTSPAIRRLSDSIEAVAPTDASVLVIGESGTGKELVAREIHNRSSRRDRPLVKVNCACVSKELYESEFFGHVKGAFTGAVKDRKGRFELADGGTLFLDEVGEIPIELQSKLLRVLQEGDFESVGEEKTRTVDVRIIAATNRELPSEIEAGRFREDLYYRLNVYPIVMPPLRQRMTDIPMLARHFVATAGKKFNCPIPQLEESHFRELDQYHWPGNVRELQNAIERAVITSRTGELRFGLLKVGRTKGEHEPTTSDGEIDEILTDAEFRSRERNNLLSALERAKWRIQGPGGAAELLDVKPTTLRSRMKAMGIDRESSSS